MKYGFLFGAGAEIAYKLPSGGHFALDIFRQDPANAKEKFKNMRGDVEPSTTYASQWLPNDYLAKNINTFGKNVFQSIIMSTVEHRRNQIISNVNNIDEVANKVLRIIEAEGIDVNKAFEDLLKRDVSNIHMNQIIAYNDVFKQGNKLFESTYFSGLLMVYRNVINSQRRVLGKILLAIMQLHLGALSEDLSRNISDNLFARKDEQIDILDDFGDLIQLNYNSTGVLGLELLLDKPECDTCTPYGVVLYFAQLLLEEIYASVIDYKSLIDSNWHYLYNPNSDWAKFCRIAIFLITVQQYISDLGDKADRDNTDGYYNMLSKSLEEGQFEISAIATTNYNRICEEILGETYPVTYLNGSIDIWYDPYLNKIGTEEELNKSERHIIVPLLFTQSGTKPMTSIGMAVKYVDIYNEWKDSDAIVVVGFGFGQDDEHINGILRTLVNDHDKRLIVVTLKESKSISEKVKELSGRLKILDNNKISIIYVEENGLANGKKWTECLD